MAKRTSPSDRSPTPPHAKRPRTSPRPAPPRAGLADLVANFLGPLKRAMTGLAERQPPRRLANGHARAHEMRQSTELGRVVRRLPEGKPTPVAPSGSLALFTQPASPASRSATPGEAPEHPIELSDSDSAQASATSTPPRSPYPRTRQPVVVRAGHLFPADPFAAHANAEAGPSSSRGARRAPVRPDASVAPRARKYDWQRSASPASSLDSAPRGSLRARKTKAAADEKERARKVDRVLDGIGKSGDGRAVRSLRNVREMFAARSKTTRKERLFRQRQELARGDGDEKGAYQHMLEASPPPGTLDAAVSVKKKEHVLKPTPKARPPPAAREPSEYIARLRLEDEIKDREIAARVQKDVIPAALKPDQAAKVDAAFADRAFRRQIGGADVQHKSLQRLKPGTWLDDEIVNFYGAMIAERAKEAGEKVVYFNTFFYEKLSTQGYAGGKLGRWTKRMKVDIFESDRIVIPINVSNMHWTACVIDMRAKRIAYFDSMADGGGRRRQIFEHMRSFLQEEHLEKKKAPLSLDDWTDHFDPNTPQQANGSDCGVFACQTLESAARGRDLAKPGGFEFAAKHMALLRRLMVFEIASGKLAPRW